ncbi:MAG: selenocysteine-specific translation elongation factor [Planctomycetaceae bacterium]|nr:selenocysteine-specific translation elongation factor [Planctomycetaceae bacterium]
MDPINLTIGTAGHIDHGKTALVKCLTGCDTDRLKEEKERGMSIELGFAPCRIAGTQIGIVDVPGHENFVKTMVAGAAGMDAVLLVVAADDGVMPQTREHLDILTLLGVRRGLVALTKIDRVATTDRAAVQADVAAFLQGTFLENAPILPLSNVTGEGFDVFLESFEAMVRSMPPRPVDGVFRLPVERAFSSPGYGTVVAGIPLSGSARVGEQIVLLPQNLTGRIRRIEVYGQASDTVLAGQCAALNVGQWDHHEIRRGCTLTVPGCFTPQQWFLGSLRLLARDPLRLKSGVEVRFHTGTAEVAATFYLLRGSAMAAGEQAIVQFKTKAPVVAGPGDHFLARTLSPVRTLGGGVIVEAVAGRVKARRPGVYDDLQERAAVIFDERRFVEYCVRRAERIAVSEWSLVERTKIPPSRLHDLLAELVDHDLIFSTSAKGYVHRETADALARNLLEQVADAHRRSPESPGPSAESIRLATACDKPVFDAIVARLKRTGQLLEKNDRLAQPGHRCTFHDDEARQLDAIEALFLERLFHPPDADEVAERISAARDKVERLLGLLCEHGRLVDVEGSLLFHHEAIVRACDIVKRHFEKEKLLESVQFKYLIDTTRKFALPLLDYLDRLGATRRVGNTRYPKGLSNNAGGPSSE